MSGWFLVEPVKPAGLARFLKLCFNPSIETFNGTVCWFLCSANVALVWLMEPLHSFDEMTGMILI